MLEVPAVRVDRRAAQEEVILAGIDPNVFQDAGALIVVRRRRADAYADLRDGGAVLVPASFAAREGIAVGDASRSASRAPRRPTSWSPASSSYTIPARTPDGALLISAADARDRFGVDDGVAVGHGPPAGRRADRLRRGGARHGAQLAAQPLTARDLAGDLGRSLDRLLGLFDVLALIAVVIGALGIVNTLGIGVSERVREIAILRSHGMTVGQVQAMVVAEAAIMGAIAGVLAIVTGLGVAFALVNGGAAADLGAGLSGCPWALLVAVVLVGTGVAALAGLYPARVAASLPIVRHLTQFE